VRGASTISMQLAKNLYLSREKTSSQAPGGVLTHLPEQEPTSDQIRAPPERRRVRSRHRIGPAAAYYSTHAESALARSVAVPRPFCPTRSASELRRWWSLRVGRTTSAS
jgi:hypothetical protein